MKTRFTRTVLVLVGILALSILPLRATLIPPANLTATASSSYQVRTPDKAVDGAGLTGLTHDANPDNMWLSTGEPIAGTWFQVDLGQVYQVDSMLVWNYNEGNFNNDRGIQDAAIWVSNTGLGTPGDANWTLAIASQLFAIGPSSNTYNTPDLITLGVTTRYLGFVVIDSWGAVGNVGLSEVQFFEAVPEPGTLALLGLGGMLVWAKRRQ